MAANRVLESIYEVGHSKELVFAGDGVRLAAQIDYPATISPASGFPLVFILHHAGCNALEDYQHYAQAAIDCGYAIFRWDKRGTGRSGASGRGSTTQDAVNAYQVALEQPSINPRQVIILAQGAGTGLLGSSYGLFARVQVPYGVILVGNMLDEKTIQAIDTRVQIVVGQNDWSPWQKFGKAACDAHNAQYKYGATFYVAPYADRNLIDPRTEEQRFHAGALMVIQDWLRSQCPPSELI